MSALTATNTNLESMLRERTTPEPSKENLNYKLQLQAMTAKYDEEKKARQEYEQKVSFEEI